MSSKIQVERLTDPNVLLVPAVQDLIRGAWSHSRHAPNAFDEHPEEFVSLLLNTNNGVFVGVEDGELLALGIAVLPSPLDGIPHISALYNTGSRRLKEAVMQAGIDFMRDAGYTTFMAQNLTGKSGKVWKRSVAPKGAKVTKVGTLYELSL